MRTLAVALCAFLLARPTWAQDLSKLKEIVKKDKFELVHVATNFQAKNVSDSELIFRHYLAALILCEIPSPAAEKVCTNIKTGDVLRGMNIHSIQDFLFTPARQALVLEMLQTLKVTRDEIPDDLKPKFQTATDSLIMVTAKMSSGRSVTDDLVKLLALYEHITAFYAMTPSLRPYAKLLNELRAWAEHPNAGKEFKPILRDTVRGGDLECALSDAHKAIYCTANGKDEIRLGWPENSAAEFNRLRLSISPSGDLVCAFYPDPDRPGERDRVYCSGRAMGEKFDLKTAQLCKNRTEQMIVIPARWGFSEPISTTAPMMCGDPHLQVMFGAKYNIVGVLKKSDLDQETNWEALKKMLAAPVDVRLASATVHLESAICYSNYQFKLICRDPNGPKAESYQSKGLNLYAFPMGDIRRLRALGKTLCVDIGLRGWLCRRMPNSGDLGPYRGDLSFLDNDRPVIVSRLDGGKVRIATTENPPIELNALGQDFSFFETEGNKILCHLSPEHRVQCQSIHGTKFKSHPFDGLKKVNRLLNLNSFLCALTDNEVHCVPKKYLKYGGTDVLKAESVGKATIAPDRIKMLSQSEVLLSEMMACTKPAGEAKNLSCVDLSNGQTIDINLGNFDGILDLPRPDQFCVDSINSYRCYTRNGQPRGIIVEKMSNDK